MGAHLVYGSGDINSMRFDVVISETHRFSASVTEHPVEKGPNITDNVRAELDTVTLEVFVSNTPIRGEKLINSSFGLVGVRGVISPIKLDIPEYKAPLVPTPGAVFGAIGDAVGSVFGTAKKVEGAQVLQFATPFNSVSEIYAELRSLRDAAQIIKVITPHWDYSSMVITAVDMSRTSAEGVAGARFSIELKQIIQIETKRTTEPVPTQDRAKKAKNKGTKGLVTVSSGESKAYYLKALALDLARPKI